MPELPDVEVFRRRLDDHALHRRIEYLRISAPELLEEISARRLRQRLEGETLRRTRRHGKHLFAASSGGGWLRLHFGMTGDLDCGAGEPPRHTRLLLDFDNRFHLAFVNTRKLGRIGWVDDVDRFVDRRGLGPDALGIDLDAFRERIDGRRGTIKATLMNQEVLAGIGNVYADEVLFQAGLHPESHPQRLRDSTFERLHDALRRVLDDAVAAGVEEDSFPDDFLLPHREPDGECPRCGRRLRKIRVSGRPTYFCTRDQRRKT